MEKGTKKAIKIVAISILVLGFGYAGWSMYNSSAAGQRRRNKKSVDVDEITEEVTAPSAPASTTIPVEINAVPFTNSEEGNAFRAWVNQFYPDKAKQYDLDPTGSYNNVYIRNAYKELGDLYLKYVADKKSKAKADELAKKKAAEQKKIDDFYAKVLAQFKKGAKVYAKKTSSTNNIYKTPFLDKSQIIAKADPNMIIGTFKAAANVKGWMAVDVKAGVNVSLDWLGLPSATENIITAYVPLTQVMAKPY